MLRDDFGTAVEFVDYLLGGYSPVTDVGVEWQDYHEGVWRGLVQFAQEKLYLDGSMDIAHWNDIQRFINTSDMNLAQALNYAIRGHDRDGAFATRYIPKNIRAPFEEMLKYGNIGFREERHL